jgi:hypothetical protein
MNTLDSSFPLEDATRLRASPGASWGAILAGAVVAVAISVVLVTLGAGLGFASISPWQDRGLSAASFTAAGAIWLIVTQWVSAAGGGYLAGRLRQRWLATHSHEVFFRDTAHGLVTWSVATLLVAAVLAGSAASLMGGVSQAAGGLVAAGARSVPTTGAKMHSHGPMGPGVEDGPGAYVLDKLFRGGAPGTTPDAPPRGRDSRMEAAHIAASAATGGDVNTEDRAYLANAVAVHTGVTPEEAQKRVDAFVQSVKDAAAKVKAEADEARKAAATAALFTALALLIGAFIASVAAVLGGRQRDEHV